MFKIRFSENQVIHRRVIRQIYHIHPGEWDEKASGIRTGDRSLTERQIRLVALQERIDHDMRRIGEIVEKLEKRPHCYSSDDIVDAFSLPEKRLSLFCFMREVYCPACADGQIPYRRDIRYRASQFFRIQERRDIVPDEVDADMIQLCEAYLHGSGLVRDTTSFYMHTLRAVYNRTATRFVWAMTS